MEVWRTSNCSPGAEDILVVVANVRKGVVAWLYVDGLMARVVVLAGVKILDDNMWKKKSLYLPSASEAK